MTFAEYRTVAERAAAGLADFGVTGRSRVSWILPTWHESLVLVAALARLGAVQNPIIPIYREREVAFITAQAASDVLVVPASWRGFDYSAMADTVMAANGGRPRKLVCDRRLPVGDPAILGAPPADGASPRWLFYTSGTTADPKGARHSDATLLAAARGMAGRLELGPEDRHGIVFPFAHVGGTINLCASLLSGAASIIVEAFDPVPSVEVLRRQGATLAGAGTAFHLAYLEVQRQHPEGPIFPKLRGCPGGGAAKPAHIHAEVKAELGGAGVLSGWGLTEAPILAMSGASDPDDKLAVTEGRPMPGVDLRVVDGELRARAPQMMLGYVEAGLDAAAFDEHGYLRTGDLGHLDDDGYVVITGRQKDVIVRNGENVSAKEVEDLLGTHPAVADVAVIGVPDDRTGERVCAVIVPSPGSSVDLDEIRRRLVEAHLRVQAVPEQLLVLPALPRGATGKVDKGALTTLVSTPARQGDS